MQLRTVLIATSAIALTALGLVQLVGFAQSTTAAPTATLSSSASASTSSGSATGAANCGTCQGNQGNGSGNGGSAIQAPANPPSKYLSVPDSLIVIPQLVPGLTASAKVTVVNENSGTTSVQSISGEVLNLPAVCGVSVPTMTIPGGYSLGKKGDSHEFLVPVVMADNGSNQNICKKASYSIKFTVLASGK